MKKYKQYKVQPFHLFLAISAFDNSFLSKLLPQPESLYALLIEYYKKQGYFAAELKRSGIISRLKNKLRISGH
ncbi:hypothetical protein BH11BAC3_BH11BAC3_37230 [soil metagenome]